MRARFLIGIGVTTAWLIDKATGAGFKFNRQTRQMFERELAAIAERFAKLSTNSTQAEKERLEAEALLKTSDKALDRAAVLGGSDTPRPHPPRLPARQDWTALLGQWG